MRLVERMTLKNRDETRGSPPAALLSPMPALLPAATLLDPHHPWHIAHEGYTVLVMRPDGTLDGVQREGLFDFDTRILSHYRLILDGRTPDWVGGGVIGNEQWTAQLVLSRGAGSAVGPALPQDTFEIALRRHLGCGMAERIVVRNHSMVDADTELAIELGADFADIQEDDGVRQQQGTIEVRWDEAAAALEFLYRVAREGRTLERGLRVCVHAADSPPTREGTTLRFHLRLPAHGSWSARLAFASLVDGTWRQPRGTRHDAAMRERDRMRKRWCRERTRIVTTSPLATAIIESAADTLIALRNWEYDSAPDAWLPNAGVPTYTGIFGRDTITAAWQAALLGPEMLRGTLAQLSAHQAVEDSAWRDEEPGKLPHEIRRGPLSELDIIPQRAYFGEQTAPAMFVVALAEYWHWTGDTGALTRYRAVAHRISEWAERYGDRDGDGLLEYARRSPKGLKNQGWKDSDEAIRYADGTLVDDPIATIEEQAYHYVALQRMAEILLVLGEDIEAERYLERARALYHRVNDAYWMEGENFYAMALDPGKRPVTSIGSNAGHALAAGMVPPERARAVADRLLAPDMFTGWGIRTLSARHPSYNPYAYHLGTVWPVENATFALGLKRYGLDEHVERLATAMFAAAAHFERYRLPELLGGHRRAGMEPPTIYPGSNSPQAWSASAVVQFVQVMLGLYPFAPARVLALVRPRLPAWLDALELHGVRVGNAVVSLRFTRREDGSAAHEVIARRGDLHVVAAPPPIDLLRSRESTADHLKEWALRHAPGTAARALRVALGIDEP
jgi:glycogen debranching enzyme